MAAHGCASRFSFFFGELSIAEVKHDMALRASRYVAEPRRKMGVLYVKRPTRFVLKNKKKENRQIPKSPTVLGCSNVELITFVKKLAKKR